MNILFMLIGVSLFAALIFLALFIWAVRSGQYDDNYTPSVRILFEDEEENDEKNVKIWKFDDSAIRQLKHPDPDFPVTCNSYLVSSNNSK